MATLEELEKRVDWLEKHSWIRKKSSENDDIGKVLERVFQRALNDQSDLATHDTDGERK